MARKKSQKKSAQSIPQPPPPSRFTSKRKSSSKNELIVYEDEGFELDEIMDNLGNKRRKNTSTGKLISLKSSNSIKSEKQFCLIRLSEFFNEYKVAKEKETDPDQIGPEGIEKLCSDLSIDIQGVSKYKILYNLGLIKWQMEVLILAYHMRASEMGYFSEQEFANGMKNLSCDSLLKLSQRINQKNEKASFITEILGNDQKFKDFYKWLFEFAKPRFSRVLDTLIATTYWGLVLPLTKNYFKKHVDGFCTFLLENNLKVVTKDQWFSFPEFCFNIGEDFENWEEGSA
ncbi:hypothetical protein HK096_006826, partial [Nowakowskiella sp. JEL0078]